MQKNVPRYTPSWVPTMRFWAESSQREVTYALCIDRRTLLWFANQRAVEYHPTLVAGADLDHPTHLVLDLDPPTAERLAFQKAVHAARLVRSVLADAGLDGAVKTSGAKGLHVIVPLDATVSIDEAAAATRAVAARAEALDPLEVTTAFLKEDRGGRVFVDASRVGGATVVAVYSPRVRPGVPVSFPVRWDDLDDVSPADFTIHSAPGLLTHRDVWAELLPSPQRLPTDLVEQGRSIAPGRVQAMHEGRRRARARRTHG